MSVHDSHHGAAPEAQTLEARARVHGEDLAAVDQAFWVIDAAKAAVGMLYNRYREQADLLLDGTITVTREGDEMIARLTPTT